MQRSSIQRTSDPPMAREKNEYFLKHNMSKWVCYDKYNDQYSMTNSSVKNVRERFGCCWKEDRGMATDKTRTILLTVHERVKVQTVWCVQRDVGCRETFEGDADVRREDNCQNVVGRRYHRRSVGAAVPATLHKAHCKVTDRHSWHILDTYLQHRNKRNWC